MSININGNMPLIANFAMDSGKNILSQIAGGVYAETESMVSIYMIYDVLYLQCGPESITKHKL